MPTQLLSGAILAVAAAALFAAPARAESKSFVVTWFGQAMNSKDGDCGPGGPSHRIVIYL